MAITIALCFPACYYLRGLGALLMLAITLVMGLLIHRSANRNLHSILIRDMDPGRYKQEVLENKYLRLGASYFATCALFAGEYQTALNICEHGIAHSRRPRIKCAYLTQMARIYFELGDIPQLQQICARYDAIAPVNAKEGFMTYYRHYAAGEYQACVDDCVRRDQAAPAENAPHIGSLNSSLHVAFALAQLGDRENAEKQFAAVARYAPKMYAATIARQYLETGSLPQVLGLTPRPEETVSAVTRKRLTPVLMAIAVALLLLQPLFFPIRDNSLQEYNRKLDAAVADTYTEYKILGSLFVEKDGKTLQTLCVIQSGNQLDLVTVTTMDGGETYNITQMLENFEVGKAYCPQSPIDQQYYRCSFTYYEPYAPNAYGTGSFTYNNTTVWLCVDYVGAVPSYGM